MGLLESLPNGTVTGSAVFAKLIPDMHAERAPSSTIMFDQMTVFSAS